MATFVAGTLAQATVVQALFDSLIERLVNRVSREIPSVIENSIKQYAIDNMANINKAKTSNHLNHHHALLLNTQSDTHNKNNTNPASDDDMFWVNSVLKLVDERLKTLEILQMADLNVSLSHLSDAKHALHMNNVKRFKYFIEQSYLKAREALFKISNHLLYKVYVYSILIFDGFMMFSDYGDDLFAGLCFIHKLLSEIQSDQALNEALNKSLSSWRWNTFDKTLIGHCILFSTKIASLVRAVKNRLKEQPSSPAKSGKVDQETKQLKSLFYEIQNNCTVLRTVDTEQDQKYEHQHEMIQNIDNWIPNVWNGYFFGTNDKCQNTVIAPKHYLNLFQIAIKNTEQDTGGLWMCESTSIIYEYLDDSKMWLTVSDSLLFDYYYHNKLNNQHNKVSKVKKKFNVKAFNDHFNKYMIGNRLIIRKKWVSIHPKLKLLLKDCLRQKLKNITTLDLSFNDKAFGLSGMEYICNAVNIHGSTISTLKMTKNDLDFQCIQLFVISLLSIGTNRYSSLQVLNISYNTGIEDDSIYLLLNKGIATKCPHLTTLYVQWTNISSLSAKYIVSFYESNPYHALSQWYLNGNKNISSQGAVVLNAALQGILIHRRRIMINISDCKINVSQLVRFDKRLVVNN